MTYEMVSVSRMRCRRCGIWQANAKDSKRRKRPAEPPNAVRVTQWGSQLWNNQVERLAGTRPTRAEVHPVCNSTKNEEPMPPVTAPLPWRVAEVCPRQIILTRTRGSSPRTSARAAWRCRPPPPTCRRAACRAGSRRAFRTATGRDLRSPSSDSGRTPSRSRTR